ncbi:uncharacterized protein LOC122498436 [Leptopilina heterotoma]|uniref:uncharacterized protein LOC122498436 n=1 Tax=Leptopilina heterotoma TaxID=63436 RepID=UPI001CA993E8|nr:uncharacterized protein LOC122498436 [Leptopilina heterotoma]
MRKLMIRFFLRRLQRTHAFFFIMMILVLLQTIICCIEAQIVRLQIRVRLLKMRKTHHMTVLATFHPLHLVKLMGIHALYIQIRTGQIEKCWIDAQFVRLQIRVRLLKMRKTHHMTVLATFHPLHLVKLVGIHALYFQIRIGQIEKCWIDAQFVRLQIYVRLLKLTDLHNQETSNENSRQVEVRNTNAHNAFQRVEEIVDNDQVHVGENVHIHLDVWESMKLKNDSKFVKELAVKIWGREGLQKKCLN